MCRTGCNVYTFHPFTTHRHDSRTRASKGMLRTLLAPRAASRVSSLLCATDMASAATSRLQHMSADFYHAAAPRRWAEARECTTSYIEAAASTTDVTANEAAKMHGTSTLVPALAITAWTLLPDLIPHILLVGKRTSAGKNKRYPSKANHGSRPCSHVGRRQRAAAKGRLRPPIR